MGWDGMEILKGKLTTKALVLALILLIMWATRFQPLGTANGVAFVANRWLGSFYVVGTNTAGEVRFEPLDQRNH